jgi:hypothetical protein
MLNPGKVHLPMGHIKFLLHLRIPEIGFVLPLGGKVIQTTLHLGGKRAVVLNTTQNLSCAASMLPSSISDFL